MLHYLLASYGAKIFITHLRESPIKRDTSRHFIGKEMKVFHEPLIIFARHFPPARRCRAIPPGGVYDCAFYIEVLKMPALLWTRFTTRF